MTRAARIAAATVCCAGLGCGGLIGGSPDGGDAATMMDSSSEGGLDGGSTKCEAPSGVSICGGPNDCGAQCTTCLDGDAGDLNVCGDVNFYFDAGASVVDDPFICPDGAFDACGDEHDAPECMSACTTEDIPKLYLLNGRPDLARYADRSTYTGAPLPPPATTCPTVAQGLLLCGGADAFSPCGSTCKGATEVCTGRSPLHPYSMCVPTEPTSFPCSRGNGGYCDSIRSGFMCLTYEVDSAAQSIADQNSLCVPSSLCQAAASSYPGGAFCTPGN